MHRILHGADFQALEVFGCAYRQAVVGEVAEAVFAPCQGNQFIHLKTRQDVLPDRAVEYLVCMRRIAEQKGDVGEQGFWHKMADRAG